MTTPVPVPTPAGLEPAFDLAAYYPVLIYAAVVVGLAVAIVAASHVPFLKPRKPTRVKQMPYESGMDPVGSARMQFDVKFYLIAILFLVFDVELLFLYPWAVMFDKLAWFGFIEMMVFLAILIIGYAYVWRRGALQWA